MEKNKEEGKQKELDREESQDKLIQEQARSSKLETELKEAQAKLAGKK